MTLLVDTFVLWNLGEGVKEMVLESVCNNCYGIVQRQKESTIDLEKLNSARRRLQENYQEAQNGLVLFVLWMLFSGSWSVLYWLGFGFLCCFFAFLKLKSKGQYKWWISMSYQSQRMPSLPRTKAAFRGGVIADLCHFIFEHTSCYTLWDGVFQKWINPFWRSFIASKRRQLFLVATVSFFGKFGT